MSIRDQMKSQAAAKISKLRNMNNEHKSLGGTARKGYAAGGEIGGGDIGGAMAAPSLSRPGRSKSGKGKKGGTNVNVIVMPHAPGAPPMGGAGPADGAPMPMAKPPMPMPPPGPSGPLMGAGGPPMMGRKTGGRVHMTAGAQSGEGRLEKADAMKKKGK